MLKVIRREPFVAFLIFVLLGAGVRFSASNHADSIMKAAMQRAYQEPHGVKADDPHLFVVREQVKVLLKELAENPRNRGRLEDLTEIVHQEVHVKGIPFEKIGIPWEMYVEVGGNLN